VVLIELINMAEISVVAVCAIKKASLSMPAPNFEAMRTSRKKPRILLVKENNANIMTDFIALLALVKVVRSLFWNGVVLREYGWCNAEYLFNTMVSDSLD